MTDQKDTSSDSYCHQTADGRTLRGVVFDMDGLMFNSETIYDMVGDTLLQRRGYRFSKELKDAMMGLPPEKTFGVMIDWHKLDDDWKSLSVESNEVFLTLIDDHLEMMPGLAELLDALEAAGIPKAIGTSSSIQLAHPCLNKYSLIERFTAILTCESITRGKPNPEIYEKAAAKLGLSSREVLIFEDSHYGCRAAHAAGALTVAVPGEHSMDHDFSMADFVANSLADPRIYETLGISQG